MAHSYRQGVFRPRNKEKYKGNVTNIIYRSGWELKYMVYLDKHPDVLKWSSEELVVPYISPVDGRMHRYFPDFIVWLRTPNGPKTLMIEVKPKTQTQEPKIQKRITESYVRKVMTSGVNQAKWKAAEEFCKDKGWEFTIMTEDELFK